MFFEFEDTINSIEQDSGVISVGDYKEKIRHVGLIDYTSLLWNLPSTKFLKTSSLFPSMSSEDVQKMWTGNYGDTLLLQSVSFVRSLVAARAYFHGKSIANTPILDFGCGYGRLLRPMSFYSSELTGVDPMASSIEECKKCNLDRIARIAKSSFLPSTLDLGVKFGVIYSFSVFTHLSFAAANICAKALREAITSDGLLAITIRPAEYWRLPHVRAQVGERTAEQLFENHVRGSGFSYRPHALGPGSVLDYEGLPSYGDTSINTRIISQIFPDWRFCGFDRSLDDPYQSYIFLQPN